MAKLTIAFDPGYDVWVNQAFRDLMKDIAKDTAEIELYMITTDPDTTFINDVATEIGLDSTKVFQVATDADVLTKIQFLGVRIYLVGSQELVSNINTNYTIELKTPPSGCQAITVSNLLDRYKLQPLYVTHLQFWIGQISKYIPGEEEKC